MGLTLSQNVILLAYTLTIIPLTQGIPRFTQEPPGVVYVSSGGTARLVWDYYVRNRTRDFDPFTPEWAFYNTSGTRIRIGNDNGFRNWTFVISRECPSRMRNRISKESTATLVISNMTIADSGIYECSLVLTRGPPTKSKTRIVVTEPPHFNTSLSSKTIAEGSSLSLQCSATGNPLPNVTWVRIQDDVLINEGHGHAVLRIVNITRQQSGTYECRAANNPNEDPVSIRTEISVKFSPEPTNASVSEIQVSPEPTNISVSEIQGKTFNNTDYFNIKKAMQFSKVLAGVIGVIIFLLLVSTAVLVVLMKKMRARKKERKIRNESSKKSLDRSVPGIYGTCQEEEEIQSPENAIPIYAQIDKSKKRRPGQVVYAKILGSEAQEEALSSGPIQLPPKYIETQYADIDTNQLEPKCHTDPLYEILNGD